MGLKYCISNVENGSSLCDIGDDIVFTQEARMLIKWPLRFNLYLSEWLLIVDGTLQRHSSLHTVLDKHNQGASTSYRTGPDIERRWRRGVCRDTLVYNSTVLMTSIALLAFLNTTCSYYMQISSSLLLAKGLNVPYSNIEQTDAT